MNHEWGSEQNHQMHSVIIKCLQVLKLPTFNVKVSFNEEGQHTSPVGLLFLSLNHLCNFKVLFLSNHSHSQMPLIFLLFFRWSLCSPRHRHVIRWKHFSRRHLTWGSSALWKALLAVTLYMSQQATCFNSKLCSPYCMAH